MKKLLALALVAVFSLSLAVGCGGSTTTGGTGSTAKSADTGKAPDTGKKE